MSGIAKLSGLFFVLAACCAGSVSAPAIEVDSIYLHPGVRAPAWSTVQPRVAQWTRTCSYDRAGSGFSSAGPMPRTSTRIADELHDALHNAGIRGPYILVGHAFGSVNMQTFADRHMLDVAGLVLIDTDVGDVDQPDVLQREHAVFVEQESDLKACRDAPRS